MSELRKKAKQFLRDKTKHHNWTGIVHYGDHGEKEIDAVQLLVEFAESQQQEGNSFTKACSVLKTLKEYYLLNIDEDGQPHATMMEILAIWIEVDNILESKTPKQENQ